MNTLLQFKGFLNTPSLFTEKTSLINYPVFSISSFEVDPNFIPDIKENLMLGKRVEYFFKQYLNSSTEFEIIIENLQVFQDKRTIGEIDFIITNKQTNEKSHIELTYKFYLFDPNYSNEEIKNWIGPNRNDSLTEKISKLTEKQFPLLYSDFIEEPLIKTNRGNMNQQVCFQAQLFIPYTLKDTVFTHINPNAIKGYYFHYENFIKKDHSDFLYFISKKQDWLIAPHQNTKWFSFEAISDQLGESIVKKKSPLIWSKDKNNQTNSLFITWW